MPEEIRFKQSKDYSMTKLLFTIIIFTICAVSVSAQIYLSPDAVKTNVIDAEDLENLVRSPENNKPLLINFWATWCGPCRVEFPDLVEIDRDYREKGLDFVIVSIDDFGMIDTRIPEFLAQYEASMPSFLIDLNSTETIRAVRRIAPKFAGTYPFTVLFNAKGKLVYQKSGVIDPKILRKEIERVLPKSEK
jgi:thiol-disulfide isomerase/thioredoxin